MLKQEISYTDYNNNARKEDFYFNLTKSEVVELEASIPGGLSEKLKQIVSSKDGNEIMKVIKEFIMKSFGQRSPDGRFIKSEQISIEFTQTVAYDQLFYGLVTNPEKAASFIESVLPQDLPAEKLNTK